MKIIKFYLLGMEQSKMKTKLMNLINQTTKAKTIEVDKVNDDYSKWNLLDIEDNFRNEKYDKCKEFTNLYQIIILEIFFEDLTEDHPKTNTIMSRQIQNSKKTVRNDNIFLISLKEINLDQSTHFSKIVKEKNKNI